MQKHIESSHRKKDEMTLIIIHEVLPKMCRMQQFESLPFLGKDIIFRKNAIPNVYFEFGWMFLLRLRHFKYKRLNIPKATYRTKRARQKRKSK